MIAPLLRSVVYGIVGSGVLALGLIASQRPNGTFTDGGLDFTQVLAKSDDAPVPGAVTMRDGYDLQVRKYTSGADGLLILLLHGSGWNGLQFTNLAPSLLKFGRILVPDLRGHGAKPGRRGDVDYIGQLEDDLADLIDAERAPGQKVVLIGHSSGGGLAVRMAGGAHGDMLDGAILLAPFLKYNAPATRENSGGWARPLTRRIIGLSMLNAVGIELLNSVPVIEFNMPKAVLDGPLGDLATTQYSYRMNVSYAPRSDYFNDISSLPPFLVVTGEQDEAFVAQQFEPLMSAQTAKGRYHIVPETGHLDIVDSPQALAAIEDYLDGF